METSVKRGRPKLFPELNDEYFERILALLNQVATIQRITAAQFQELEEIGLIVIRWKEKRRTDSDWRPQFGKRANLVYQMITDPVWKRSLAASQITP